MAISYQAEDVKIPPIKKRRTTDWIKAVVASHRKVTGDIAFIFCSDKKILEINNQYLQHDYYTDIITFDYSEENTIAGDIFISLDTVKSNSEKFKTEYDEELNRVMIHGILHLCGINDKQPCEREYMAQCENKALEMLKG
jgi:rRNA maturation RNase YbeY